MKKILLVLIALFVMITPNFKVEALEDSFTDNEYIPNTYMVKKRGNSGKYQQMRVFRRRSDNQAVYCIELWEGLNTTKNITGYDHDQYNYAGIETSLWEKIMLISYYGYGYGSHTDIKWYAVTQFMIWQITSPDSDIYFTDTLNGNRITKYVDEMNEINTLIQNHTNVPSFYNQSYNINYKQSYTIIDTNNLLDKFDIIGDGGLEINKIGNQLTVKANKVFNSQILLANTDKKYSTNPIVYVDPDGQDLVAPGSYNPIYMVVNFNTPVSNILISKKDMDNQTNISLGDAKLEGSKFQLLDIDNQVIQEKEVNQNGELVFENIGYGNYYIKEISPGEGYLLNSEIISIEVNDTVENIDFYNQVIKNKVIFHKYIINPLTGEKLLEKDAVFSIYNKNNEKMITFTTDQNGYYELELPYGRYTVKQEKGLKNHYFIDDFEISITEDGKIQTFDLYNEELTANIKIMNTDLDSNLPILESGASFEIRNLDSNELFILNTNDFGSTEDLTLSSGNYEIKQINTVDDYDMNDDIYSFKIDEEIEFEIDDSENKYLEIIISNKKLKSTVEIEKYIEYYLNDNLVKKEKDDNISISIYAKEDIYSKDGLKIYSKDEEVGVTKLEDTSVITPLLMFGNYYFNNPIDNSIIEIILDKMDNDTIELLEKIYEYEEKIENIPQYEQISNNIDIFLDDNTNDLIIEVPNTLSYQSLFSDINIFFIILGLFLIRRVK